MGWEKDREAGGKKWGSSEEWGGATHLRLEKGGGLGEGVNV